MSMHSGKEQRVRQDPGKAPGIAFDHSVKIEPEDKLLDHRRDDDSEDNNEHALLQSLRFVEQFDNALPTRRTAEHLLAQEIRHDDERISSQKQHTARHQVSPEGELGEAG